MNKASKTHKRRVEVRCTVSEPVKSLINEQISEFMHFEMGAYFPSKIFGRPKPI